MTLVSKCPPVLKNRIQHITAGRGPLPGSLCLTAPSYKRATSMPGATAQRLNSKWQEKIQPQRFVREAATDTSTATRAANNWARFYTYCEARKPRPYVKMSENVRAGGMAGSALHL